MLIIALFFQRCKTTVTTEAKIADKIEKNSPEGVAVLKIKSVVHSLKQIKKRTAIETAGMNFSTKEKKAGVLCFAKIKKGRTLSKNIISPIARVAVNASSAVSFIFYDPLAKSLWQFPDKAP